jgi:uncharacterized protein YjbI with pentapeptide repeats
MPYVFKHRRPPEPWHEVKGKAPHRYLIPLYYANWLGEWTAYVLGKFSLLEVLEYAGSFSILIAVIFYFADSGERTKQKHYMAWQVINTAQGKGGSGGRLDALQELNDDHVPLIGVDVSDAFLQDIALPSAELRRGEFSSADMRRAVLRKTDLEGANFHLTNLRGADLASADLTDAEFRDADLTGAKLQDARLSGANLDRADLRESDHSGLRDWQAIKSVRLANLHGALNVPAGFIDWARQRGAVDMADDGDWARALEAGPATQPASRNSTTAPQ